MRKIYLLVLLVLVSSTLSAKSLSGVVNSINENNKKVPVQYAIVHCLETASAVETDAKGKFKIDIKNEEKVTLIAAYIGYQKDTIYATADMKNIEFNIYPQNDIEDIIISKRQGANFISKESTVRTELITAAGLCKMACCNLAESFENSASVTVGYSDAVTGAKQIRLLGLSGVYTSMLDENRPVMRGIASPFGLSYIPGQWLESIQIAKGPSSVINGLEAITGQINLEHRKPTTEEPLFVNLFLSSMLRTEANIASSLQLNEKWSTVLLGHFSTDPKAHDGNSDGFRDEPTSLQFNFSNRWLYMADNGTQVRFGVRALTDDRVAGAMDFDKDMGRNSSIWGSNIKNSGLNAYFKVGIPISEDQNENISIVGDYSYHKLNSFFGMKDYNGEQNSGFLNAMFQSTVNDSHEYTLGLSAKYDNQEEELNDFWYNENGGYAGTRLSDVGREEASIGAYGEYTYKLGDKLTAVGGLRLDYSDNYGFLFAPRANVKYSLTDDLVFRATGGRGFRSANIIADNLGILSTGREIKIAPDLDVEDAWTYGANVTQYFNLGYSDNAYVSFDYFRTDFNNQVIVDQEVESDKILIYNLDGKSFTNSYQVDFSVEPIERLSVIATFRYTDAKVTLDGQGLVDRPLMSKFKGVLNVQYATRMNKWTFDVTGQINGKSRLPNFVDGENQYSPMYPMLFAQVTRKFKGLDVYIGGENLLNYKQDNPIISADNPFSSDFNSTVIWGPLSGFKAYVGLRFTLWK